MQAKTTRAFRTISEAGEELDLQPHVLRFWESKFSQIKPIKRGGGRRFYRPEDIEFLRGIKILLHDEGHPIKDVQKLIRLKGPARVMELGQSVEKAATDKKVEDTVLVPKRIKKSKPSKKSAAKAESKMQPSSTGQSTTSSTAMMPDDESVVIPPPIAHPAVVHPPVSQTEPVEPPVLDAEEEANYVVKQLEPAEPEISAQVLQQRQDLEEALVRLRALKTRWSDYKAKAS